MNILDNDSDFEEEMNAEYVTNEGMCALWDLCIEPMQDKLSQEDMAVISLIGMTLKIVAEKASAYEKLQQGELDDTKENDFYRN
jgi:hypothetical protein